MSRSPAAVVSSVWAELRRRGLTAADEIDEQEPAPDLAAIVAGVCDRADAEREARLAAEARLREREASCEMACENPCGDCAGCQLAEEHEGDTDSVVSALAGEGGSQ